MKPPVANILAAPLLLALFGSAHAADRIVALDPGESGGVRIGTLECDIGSGMGYVIGSAKEVGCTFVPVRGGPSEDYAGTIRKLGIDLGYTSHGRLLWAVFAPTAGYRNGSLAGLYKGATVEATAGVGVGANVLVGGTAGSINLQLLSVTGQVGLNVAAAGTSMTLAAN